LFSREPTRLAEACICERSRLVGSKTCCRHAYTSCVHMFLLIISTRARDLGKHSVAVRLLQWLWFHNHTRAQDKDQTFSATVVVVEPVAVRLLQCSLARPLYKKRSTGSEQTQKQSWLRVMLLLSTAQCLLPTLASALSNPACGENSLPTTAILSQRYIMQTPVFTCECNLHIYVYIYI
jgi:hypothetical protein